MKNTLKNASVFGVVLIFIFSALSPVISLQAKNIVNILFSEKINIEDQLPSGSKENILNQNSDQLSNNPDPITLDISDPWWDNNWQYRKEITVNHSKVAEDLLNFPILISLEYDSNLSFNAQTYGDDIAFTDINGVQLSHEIELFNGSTGQLIAWVKVPSLSSSVDTTLYLYYGNPVASNQQNPSGVWDSGFVMVQHLNETSGSHLDSTGYSNDGICSGGVIQDAVGVVDGADDFDGSDDFVSVDHSSSLDITGSQLTLEAWAKIGVFSDYAGIVAKTNSSPPFGGYGFFVQSNGSVALYIQLGGVWTGSGWASLSSDQWYHIVGVYDGSSMKVYVDGEEEISTAASGSINSISDVLYIGRQGTAGDPSENLDGVIDEVRVSNVARNNSWVNASYQNQFNPSVFYTVGSEEPQIPHDEPQLSNENPVDGAVFVELNPILSIDATDYQGDLMTLTFRTNASGSWGDIGSNVSVGNGTYSQTPSNMNNGNTRYWWSVNATDAGSGNWTNMTFSFITGGVWWNSLWVYRKVITLDHTKVDTDLSNFPVLLTLSSDSDLADDAKCQNSGDDIAFADKNGNKLNHEIEYFNGSTGELIAWVNVTSLSSSTDTVLYMYYGNSGASSQENPNGVWDSDHVCVLHLNETSGVHVDSTVFGNDGSPLGGVNQNVVGKVDGADDFDGVDDGVNSGKASSINNINKFTFSAWVKADTWGEGGMYGNIFDKGFTSGKAFYLHKTAGTGGLAFVHGFSSGYGWWHIDNCIGLGSWYHVAVVYDNTDVGNDPVVYVNGNVVAAVEGASPSGTALSDGGFDAVFGNNQDGSLTFDGIIDEVRVSKTLRSSGWIKTGFNNQNNPIGFRIVYSEEVGILPDEPVLSDENPVDGSTGVNVNPVLSVHVEDLQGETLTVTFRSNASGSWGDVGSNVSVGNGTYTQVTSNMDSYDTVYWWSVNVSDVGGSWSNETYSFTTEFGVPILSSEDPGDGATGVALNPDLFIHVEDLQGHTMTVTFRSNASGSWQNIGANSSVGNGTYTQVTSNMDSYDTVYWWSVNVSDVGGSWSNETYSFTTRATPGVWWNTDWLYRKEIIIDSSMAVEDLVDFPVLISLVLMVILRMMRNVRMMVMILFLLIIMVLSLLMRLNILMVVVVSLWFG